MTLRSTDYASLSDAAYSDPKVDQRAPDGRVLSYKRVTIDGLEYRPIAHADNPKSGFQATAYERLDSTHEVVIAYRGTEMGRELKKDLLITDGDMAIKGVNDQGADSNAFTEKVIALAKQTAEHNHYTPLVTVTGHSLGGTEAEMNAYKYGLHGETFNAFGAAGLGLKIPEGGNQVIDHVRATDAVSAASPHFGQVRMYAVPQDINALESAGYHDSKMLNAVLPNEPILGGIQGDAHKVGNFLPKNDVIGHTILTPQNEALAKEHSNMIAEYRGEIMGVRNFAHLEYDIQKPVIDATGALVQQAERTGKEAVEMLDALKDKAVEDYHDAVNLTSRGIEATAHATTRGIGNTETFIKEHPVLPVLLNNPAHPDYAMYQHSLGAVHRLDAQNGRTPDQHSANLAAGITVGAKAYGLSKVDHVVLSDDGSKAFAVQGDLRSPFKQVANGVETAHAVNAPIEHHTQAVQQINQAQAQQQVQQTTPQMQQPVQAPGMSR